MKRLLFIFSLVMCLWCLPMVGFAGQDETAKQEYDNAIADNWKEMLKGSIALDKINAENKTYLLTWQDVENPPEEAKKLVEQIEKLQKEQEADQENMDPYTQAKKACDEKLNADGANAALENIIRIQKDLLSDQEALKTLWKKVEKLLN